MPFPPNASQTSKAVSITCYLRQSVAWKNNYFKRAVELTLFCYHRYTDCCRTFFFLSLSRNEDCKGRETRLLCVVIALTEAAAAALRELWLPKVPQER